MSVKQTAMPFLLLMFFQCCWTTFSHASDIPVGHMINPQGSVTVLGAGKVVWEEGQNGRDLFAGDSVKTGQDSRVSILCSDETQLKLNENTIVVLKSSAPSARMGMVVPAAQKEPGASLYELPAGEVWMRNKNEKARFEVQTPAVTAAIRGTEFNLKVDRAGATDLVLLEGKLTLANDQGRIDLDPGEEGFAEVGKAPVKRVVLQPKDAVQWSLYYPGIFSYRDIPLEESISTSREAGLARDKSPLLHNAIASYNHGDLGAGERDANEALAGDPENGQALLILGWISLQRQDPQKAMAFFQKALKHNAPPALTISGLALALYRAGDTVGAYKLVVAELKNEHPSSLILVMSGYFSMLAGKIDQAKALLTDSRIGGHDSAMAHSLLSQICLIQNSKEKASGEAAVAMRENGESPLVRMTAALVKISYFDLPAATRLLEQAIAADPHFLEAYVYLARLWLGADYLDRAWETIGKALEISNTDSEALSLAGFIRLGNRDYDKAWSLFTEAVKNNPGFGEPHIGLANIAFRNRNFSLGVTEMLTATLLEPRVSLYQSSLGKALYQTRSFDKALEVYDYAKTLDPNDPTPYLYKGIALADLYRPGEAVQEINKSIELNDNMAVFRSRLMLDRDLAVRNTDLARAFNQLGLDDWAYSKALTAVKNDPMNASARLFLKNAFVATGQRGGAADSEELMYRLLAPANENTFSVYADYTPMFEMPYARFQGFGGVGAWADHGNPAQEYLLEAYGGRPGFALDAVGIYGYDPGYKRVNDQMEDFSGSVQGKLEPTINDSIYASYTYQKNQFGDIANNFNFAYITDPNLRITNDQSFAEGGYVHRFSPEAVFIAYFAHGHEPWSTKDFSVSSLYDPFSNSVINLWQYLYTTQVQDFNNIQIQQQVKFGDHTLMAGLDYFATLFNSFAQYSVILEAPPPIFIDTLRFDPSDRGSSIYLRDYWHVSPQLLLELGFSWDTVSSPRAGFPDAIPYSTANPLVGINYQIDKSNTLRLAYQSYINANPSVSAAARLAPPEVAGFPSQVNSDDGAKVKELGFAWESQWNPLTFTVLRLQAHRIDDPNFDAALGQDMIINERAELFQGSFIINRLLTSSLGISAGITGKLVSLQSPPGLSATPTGDYNEISGNIGLSYMHPSGWFAQIKDTVVHQNLGGLSDNSIALTQAKLGNPFNLVDFTLEKYFPNKRGFAQLNVTNIFNQHFYYQTEPIQVWLFNPDRKIMFLLGFYF